MIDRKFRLIWLAFIDTVSKDFVGAAIIEDFGAVSAIIQSSRRQITPKNAEITAFMIPECNTDLARPYKNRLLRTPDIEKAFGPLVESELIGSGAKYLKPGCFADSDPTDEPSTI